MTEVPTAGASAIFFAIEGSTFFQQKLKKIIFLNIKSNQSYKDGSGKKYIRKNNVTAAKIKGKYIYFKETKFFPTSEYGWCTRTCRCKLNGKGRKAITGWK